MSPLRHWWHLVVRFFGVVTSKPLGPSQQDDVATVLSPSEASLFFRQQAIDQRHAYDVAIRVRGQLPHDHDAVAAALLHDVGKIHSTLGAVSRSLATVCSLLHLPMSKRWQLYRDHGEVGAGDLEAAGARPLAIAFAAGRRTGDAQVWNALVAADDAAGGGALQRISGRETSETAPRRNSMPPEVEP